MSGTYSQPACASRLESTDSIRRMLGIGFYLSAYAPETRVSGAVGIADVVHAVRVRERAVEFDPVAVRGPDIAVPRACALLFVDIRVTRLGHGQGGGGKEGDSGKKEERTLQSAWEE